jgi:hypothetical protein
MADPAVTFAPMLYLSGDQQGGRAVQEHAAGLGPQEASPMDTPNPASFSVPLVEHAKTPFPTDVDITPTADRYVGFFENRHGEQLVYVHERGARPVLYHGDYEWQPTTATMPTFKRTQGMATWVIGDELIVDETEALWLAACLAASGATDANVAEVISTQLVEDAMKAMRELPAEQRDQIMRDARQAAREQRDG